MRDVPGTIGYSVIAGSRLYGVATETSDKDFRGFYDAPEINLSRSLRNPVCEWKGDGEEYVYYSLRHFLSLLEKASPNTIELLFVPESLIQFCGNEAREIRRNADLFVTKQAAKNMLAMAKGQIEDYRQGVVRATQYMGFEKEINFKPAYHAFRLLFQFADLLQIGELRFPFEEDRVTFLKQIRNGERDPKALNVLFNTKYEAYAPNLDQCPLPEKCDSEKVDKLYYRLIAPSVSEFLKKKMR